MKVLDPKILETYLNMTEMFLNQLKAFRLNNTTSYLEADIAGYEELLKSNSENNAKMFYELKEKDRRGQLDFNDNMHVINYMKENKMWE